MTNIEKETHSPDAAENVDDAELQKFSDLATRWWDPQSEFKPLHLINPLRLDFIHQRSPLSGKKVLDVGCGGGILSESMVQLGAEVTAIDMADASLNVARLHAMESGLEIDYQKCTAEALAAQRPGEWDIITCLEMLEHVPQPASIVEACAKLVKPDGDVYFSTINRNPKSFLFAIVGAEYILNLLPKGTHEYEKFIQPSELHQWCETYGLQSQEMTGMHYNPLSGRYWLADGVDVNYLMHTKRSQH